MQVLISAEGYAQQLFQNVCTHEESQKRSNTDDLVVDDNLGFAKDRTVSRLTEMQTSEYAIAHAEMHDQALLSALGEVQQRRATG
jgi:peroxisome-assembly ATPase